MLIRDGIIQSVGHRDQVPRGDRQIDLGNAVIIPGLINAHTHLEFSHLNQPLGQPNAKFTDWIRTIVANRRDSSNTKSESIAKGLAESFESGTWVVGEIATKPNDESAYSTRCREQMVVTFLEQLGSSVETFSDLEIELASHLKLENSGASPHAPYSTHIELVRQMCEQAKHFGRPVAMHLAETKPELQLLREGSGDFVDLLKDFGVWNPESFIGGQSVLDFLQILVKSPKALVVHGNYLDEAEQNFIARHRETTSIVFCPRTHHFFGHDRYPLESFQAKQINVAVGTDSRASNPDLNLWEELKHVSDSFPDQPIETILAMGTINGAVALGVEKDYGTLESGKASSISVVTDGQKAPLEPKDLFTSGTRCRPYTDFIDQD